MCENLHALRQCVKWLRKKDFKGLPERNTTPADDLLENTGPAEVLPAEDLLGENTGDLLQNTGRAEALSVYWTYSLINWIQ